MLVLLAVFGNATGSTSKASAAKNGEICAVYVGLDDPSIAFQDTTKGPSGEFDIFMPEEGSIVVVAQIMGPKSGENTTDDEYNVDVENADGDAVITHELEDTTTSGLVKLAKPSKLASEVPELDPADFSTGLNDELAEMGWDPEADFDDDLKGCDKGVDDHVVVVVVKCERNGAGQFTVSFSDDDDPDNSAGIDIICLGQENTSTIDANPATVEIVPAIGSVAHSFIRLIMTDVNGNPSFPFSDREILWTTDRCAIEVGSASAGPGEGSVSWEGNTTGTGDSPFGDGWEGAENLFRTQGLVNSPVWGNAVENSAFALVAAPDSTSQSDSQVAFMVTSSTGTERTVGGAILHCEPNHTFAGGTATPGVATVTAIVERHGSKSSEAVDHIYTVKVTVVGPPASITVSASPTELRCGEKAAIVVVIKDAIGQNVSDHTQFEAVTNAGGVLGGTGAVIGFAGPVVPISSTVSETFGGTATFFLLTSEQHTGPYEVVVTTGGNHVTSAGNLLGLFSSPPLSVQTTVRCTIPVVAAAAPAPAPTITAPRTGDLGTTAIRPPSTGDAGLADSSSSSWLLFAVAGAVAFSLVGLATVKVTRR